MIIDPLEVPTLYIYRNFVIPPYLHKTFYGNDKKQETELIKVLKTKNYKKMLLNEIEIILHIALIKNSEDIVNTLIRTGHYSIPEDILYVHVNISTDYTRYQGKPANKYTDLQTNGMSVMYRHFSLLRVHLTDALTYKKYDFFEALLYKLIHVYECDYKKRLTHIAYDNLHLSHSDRKLFLNEFPLYKKIHQERAKRIQTTIMTPPYNIIDYGNLLVTIVRANQIDLLKRVLNTGICVDLYSCENVRFTHKGQFLGPTPLIAAIKERNIKIVKLLIEEYNADVNKIDGGKFQSEYTKIGEEMYDKGYTSPIHYAGYILDIGIVKLLLKHNANQNTKNNVSVIFTTLCQDIADQYSKCVTRVYDSKLFDQSRQSYNKLNDVHTKNIIMNKEAVERITKIFELLIVLLSDKNMNVDINHTNVQFVYKTLPTLLRNNKSPLNELHDIYYKFNIAISKKIPEINQYEDLIPNVNFEEQVTSAISQLSKSLRLSSRPTTGGKVRKPKKPTKPTKSKRSVKRV